MTDITTLVSELRKASAYYYSGGNAVEATIIMSDAEFDAKVDLLRANDPTNPFLAEVGAPVGNGAKVKHLRLMGSLEKITDTNELLKWLAGRTAIIQTKVDGCTVELQYFDRHLRLGVTRGDGLEGEDVTAAILKVKGVPTVLPLDIFPSGPVSIRGEVILTHENWEKVDPSMATNPRNVGTGILTRDDTSDAHLLTFVMFDHGMQVESDYATLAKLSDLFILPHTQLASASTLTSQLESMLSQKRDGKFGYDIDGAVIKLDNVIERDALGFSSNRPKGQRAFKWESSTVETVATGFVLTTGHTGLISPTMMLKPVKLDGVTVSNALINNMEEINRLNVAVGDTVLIRRMGELVPKIVAVVSRPDLREPIFYNSCPCCDGKIGKKQNVNGTPSVNDFCLNPECEGKAIGKVKRWLKVHKILGIGDGLLNTLLEHGVKSPADLYRLTAKELAEMPMGQGVVGLSRAKSIESELLLKTHTVSLENFIGSLGIPFIGRRRAHLMIAAADGQLDTLADWNAENLTELAGAVSMGGTIDQIAMWFQMNVELVSELSSLVTVQTARKTKEAPKEVSPVASGPALTFLLTGKFDVPKKDIHAKIAAAGHNFVEDFSSATTHLITATPDSTSSKAKKAIKNGIPIISLAELQDLLS